MQWRLRQGSETITLSGDDPITAVDYQSKVGSSDTEPVTETLAVTMSGTTTAKRAMKDKIENWLRQAQRYQDRRVGERVYLEGQVQAGGSWAQSELLGGEAVWTRPGLVDLDDVELAISWRRRNEWLEPEAQLPITNRNGTNNTAGLTVWNHTDTGAGHDNFIQINGADVLGSLPAPTRIEMTNTYNNTARLYNLWLAHNVHADPADFSHVIEAESAAYALGGAVTNNASYSNDATRSFVWAGDLQNLIARWTLSTTFLNHARGNWFKILGRFTTAPDAGVRLQFKLTFPADTAISVIASSQEVAPGTALLQDLATLQLPPWLIGKTDFAPLSLSLYARKIGGGTVSFDDLQILPMDSYRILTPRGYGAAYGVRVVDDGIDQTIWTDGWTPAGKTGHYTGQFEPIRVMPGKTQRIYFLQSTNLGGVGIDRTLSVKVFYRPRRMAI